MATSLVHRATIAACVTLVLHGGRLWGFRCLGLAHRSRQSRNPLSLWCSPLGRPSQSLFRRTNF